MKATFCTLSIVEIAVDRRPPFVCDPLDDVPVTRFRAVASNGTAKPLRASHDGRL
jgi:hypothetical protein